MNKEIIEQCIQKNQLPDDLKDPQIRETHASIVLIGEQYVYKIKKSIRFSFLDFSSLEKRKHYCYRELELNRRYSPDIYLDVIEIRRKGEEVTWGETAGDLLDYAIKMKKLPSGKEMDILLQDNLVSKQDITNLAKTISDFHKKADIIKNKKVDELLEEFNDLATQLDYIRQTLGPYFSGIISHAISISDEFLSRQGHLLKNRLEKGFYRDGHGDLHSGNIFLCPKPVLFDCLEFNDDFRQIDILNEIAFLLLDLEYYGREDLSEQFVHEYNKNFEVIRHEEDHALLTYYKAYRANIRAKVGALRSIEVSQKERGKFLETCSRYLELLGHYISLLEVN